MVRSEFFFAARRAIFRCGEYSSSWRERGNGHPSPPTTEREGVQLPPAEQSHFLNGSFHIGSTHNCSTLSLLLRSVINVVPCWDSHCPHFLLMSYVSAPLPHPPLIAIPFLPLLPIHRSTPFSFRRLLRLLQGRKWFSGGRIRKASFTVRDAAHAAWLR